ncbi:DUF416 family protein [Arthrobacter sp. ISL-5]|uniref:DUF416 family protein n=1 Tax=Arthrobacter sp. ISL-5 TaxID=2819111 RepID=UPI001BECA514|nr:DUF416 family protein [Arthrobacter sp. ISL-5]MBT2555480.1 DUF416 family protein [Arthrobacter sp. ISL-5]
MVIKMQALRIYDEPALTARLGQLDHPAKIAFSAACAQRLMPLFVRYAKKTGTDAQAQRLGEILSTAWEAASGGPVDVRGLDSMAASFGPSDDAEWVFEMGYAQNAAAAVAYAIRTCLSDDPQEAAWAARQLYEAADYAISQPDLEQVELYVQKVGESLERNEATLTSDVVQTALAFLDRDLVVVESAPPSWEGLRQQSASEGLSWAATLR